MDEEGYITKLLISVNGRCDFEKERLKALVIVQQIDEVYSQTIPVRILEE